VTKKGFNKKNILLSQKGSPKTEWLSSFFRAALKENRFVTERGIKWDVVFTSELKWNYSKHVNTKSDSYKSNHNG
jgi:hypothetical protein